MNAAEIWNEAVPHIKGSISQTGYNTSFATCKPIDFSANRFVVSVNHEIYRDMIEMYKPQVMSALEKVIGRTVEFIVTVSAEEEKKEEKKSGEKKGSYSNYDFSLNPNFTFDNFIIGSNNDFACANAFAMANKPVSGSYNLLLIYGGSGLGKTHLLHATGNAILENHPEMKVLYVTSEQFLNIFIDSIRKEDGRAFRDKFRSIDVLLLDDIQFFAGKDGVQEEFFHTFNALISQNKKIIITSDRPPKDIYPLEERLRTRLSGGLMADIKPPNYETRMAILHAKIGDESSNISDEIFDLVAKKIKSNIRELEGAIRTIMAYSGISKKNIDVEMAEKILNDYFITEKHTQINADYIIKEVANHFNISEDEIKGKKRDKEIMIPRQIAIYICRHLTNLSLPQLGREFGGRDHSTIKNSYDRIQAIMEKDLATMHTINDLIKNIKNDDE